MSLGLWFFELLVTGYEKNSHKLFYDFLLTTTQGYTPRFLLPPLKPSCHELDDCPVVSLSRGQGPPVRP